MYVEDLADLANENRADELEKLIAEAVEDYYVKNAPKVPDEVYDAWVDELKGLRPCSPQVTSVGAPPVSEWKKVRHEIPMGSLDKVNTPDELGEWLAKIGDPQELLVTEKLDGISIAIQYDNGDFVRGATRGNGIEGEDISQNVARMQGVPSRLPKPFTGELRGEILCTLSSLAEHFPDYANPRNTAGGISSRLDGVGCEHLTVLLYQVAEGADELELRSAHMLLLEELGFKTPNWYATPQLSTVEEVWNSYQQAKRAQLDYAIDGLVVELNDLACSLALGEDNGRPRGAIAFKFAPPSRETVLRAIQSPTGASGRRTPVAVFDEVNLLGTRVTNASLYNWAYINTLGLDIGAKILVARANDVIPRVTQVVSGTGTVAQPDMKCEACGAESVWEGEYLVCPNTSDCPAQAVGRLHRYVKALNILEWGEGIFEKLVVGGLARNVSDLYRLTQEQLEGVERMGAKSASKLLDTLWSKNPIPLESFFGALSIPGCGESMLTLVVDAGYDTLASLRSVTYDQLLTIKGLGPVRAKTLSDWLITHWSLVDSTLATGLKLKERVRGNLTGKSFCFTGKSNRKRSELEDLVRGAGGTVKGTVGNGLTYLVMADPNSGSTKAVAAKKHGTETISEDEFLTMVGV